jgi:DnaJ-class molecular chaperone
MTDTVVDLLHLPLSTLAALASVHFGLILPTTKTELNRAYRTACYHNHPDRGGDKEVFISIQDSYNILTEPKYALTVLGADSGATTIDGTPLSELGSGLGSKINGIECTHCTGKGYEQNEHTEWRVCGHCNFGYVIKDISCRPCNGSGKFQQKNSKRIVPCRTCNGTGIFDRRRIVCPHCRGTMTLHDTEKTTSYVKCFYCAGVGEIEMFNPVLRKGLLSK